MLKSGVTEIDDIKFVTCVNRERSIAFHVGGVCPRPICFRCGITDGSSSFLEIPAYILNHPSNENFFSTTDKAKKETIIISIRFNLLKIMKYIKFLVFP